MISSLWGRITGKDAGKTFPQQQGKSLDRLGDMAVVFPWGMYANLPNGQLFKVIDGEGKAIIGVTVERPQNVEQGEVSLWHPSTGSVIQFKNNGDLNIDTVVSGAGNVNINTITANVTASSAINIDTPLATFSTDVLINGGLTVIGTSTLGASVIAGGKEIVGHTHPAGTPPGNTGANN